MKIICNTPGNGRGIEQIKAIEIKIGDTVLIKHKPIIVKTLWGVDSGDNVVTVNKKFQISKYHETVGLLLTELPAYYSDHTTPLQVGEWDMELVWQYRRNPYVGKWQTLKPEEYSQYESFSDFKNSNKPYDTRQIYLSPLAPAQPVKAVEEEKEITLINDNERESEAMSEAHEIAIQQLRLNFDNPIFPLGEIQLISRFEKEYNLAHSMFMSGYHYCNEN